MSVAAIQWGSYSQTDDTFLSFVDFERSIGSENEFTTEVKSVILMQIRGGHTEDPVIYGKRFEGRTSILHQ